jgi:hypothetical protein
MPSHDLSSPRTGARTSSRTSPRRVGISRSAHAVEPVVTLGLSVLPSATELVVVRGAAAQGAVLDRVVTPSNDRESANGSRLQQTVDAVLQTQALAIAHGYDVRAIGVLDDAANTALTDRVIAALTRAGLGNVITLDPAVAHGLFTQLDTAAIESVLASRSRARSRRRWVFLAALLIACAALAFAIVDRMSVDRGPAPPQPVWTPPPASTPIPNPPAVEIPPPPPQAPPTVPTQEAPPADAPADPTPRRAPVNQRPTQQPVQRPAPPPPALPPVPPTEPAAPDDCMLLCGVTL